MDSELILGSQRRSLKETLERRFLLPLVFKEQSIRQMASTTTGKVDKPLYSGILFGPPGTAKTSIVTSVAYYLGWNFVTIDTGKRSASLRGGMRGQLQAPTLGGRARIRESS